jgi:hypothetical protein
LHHGQQFPLSQPVINRRASNQHFRQMSAQGVNLLQFAVSFPQQPELDVAVCRAEAASVRIFE